MISDPYSVLGVSRNATPDEIKKAYRKKAKEYHPDLHPNDPNAVRKMNEVNDAYDMLTNPGKYANRNAGQGAGYGSSGSSGNAGYGGQQSYGNRGNGSGAYGQQGGQGYQGAGGWYADFGGFDFNDLFGYGFGGPVDTTPVDDPSDNSDFRMVVTLLKQKQFSAAATRLTSIPSTMRRARWYYLYALAEHGMGENARAIDNMQRAVQMEPGNALYSRLLSQFRRSASNGANPFASAWGDAGGYGSSGSSGNDGSRSSGGSGPRTIFFGGGCLWRILIFWLLMRLMLSLFTCGTSSFYRGYNMPYGASGYYYTQPYGNNTQNGTGK
ncbi:MAG: DnaJ domain-containing protein [Clostridia bacterium]|nr:DnaJ domain-containing protein [Clostridia bacterium]